MKACFVQILTTVHPTRARTTESAKITWVTIHVFATRTIQDQIVKYVSTEFVEQLKSARTLNIWY